MTIEQTLIQRSDSQCELCASSEDLSAYSVAKSTTAAVNADQCVLVCRLCHDQFDNPETMDVNHWRSLSNSIWSQEPAVQVMVYRALKMLSAEVWAQDLLDQMYLDDDAQTWADEGVIKASDDADDAPTLDSNGAKLSEGDTVILIKDLVVKGANFTAKRGTSVRGITLTSNPEHVEGRVNGTRIVLLSCFLKKA